MKRIGGSCRKATLYILKNKGKALSFSRKLFLAYHLLICEPCRMFKIQNERIDQAMKEISIDVKKTYDIDKS
mgnify:CR=1 FL=1